MEESDINQNIESINLNNNLKDNLETISQLKNILGNDFLEDELLDMNEEEIKKINAELKNYKQKQLNTINILENELNELKKKNFDYENYIDENNEININFDNIITEKLKDDIIKQIEEEFESYNLSVDKKIKILEENNQSNYLEGKINDILVKDIIPELTNRNNIKLNLDESNQNLNIFEDKKRIEKKILDRKIGVKGNNGKVKTYKIQVNKEINANNSQKDVKRSPKLNNIKKDNNINIIRDKEDILKDENINNKPIPKLNIIKNKEYKNFFFQNEKKSNGLNLLDLKKNDNNAIKLNINELNLEQQKNLYQKKYTNEDLFKYFNDIFFNNYEQTSIKLKKIDENVQQNLMFKYVKYRKEKRENDLLNYFDNFLKSNVLKIFEREGESPFTLSIIKYNIETILECFEKNKNYYIKYYNPKGKNEGIHDRKKSTDAAYNFRRKFNIGHDIINDEQLLKKLDKNDNDINKVFQQMYG